MSSSFMNNLDFPPLQAFPSAWSAYYSSNYKHHESTNNNANCQANQSDQSDSANYKNTMSGSLSIQIPPHQQHYNAYSSISPHAAPTIVTTPPLTAAASSIAPPKYPLYLKYTNYANLITEQYQHLQLKRKRNSYDFDNKELEEVDLRLPAFWNKSKFTELNVVNGYDVTLTDPRHKHHSPYQYKFLQSFVHSDGSNIPSQQPQQPQRTPASVRTNFLIPPQCGIYYFEIRILSLGQDGVFAVGFCTSESKLDKLPGHDKFSFGYHGVDGQVYLKSIKQDNLELPDFTVGDIIGCGMNFANETLFFTKNGVLLATTSFQHDACRYYPCVGLSTLGERITANFGQESFLFDIVTYVQTQERAIKKETITATASKTEFTQEKKDMNELVLSYLMHHGYIGAANALKNNIQYIYNDNTSNTRKEDKEESEDFRKLIMAGHQIDTVIEKVNAHYPGLLNNHPELHFQLKSQKFIDMFLHDSCLQHQQQESLMLMASRSSTSSSSSSSSTVATMTDYFSSATTAPSAVTTTASVAEEDAALSASFDSFTFGTPPCSNIDQGRSRTYSLESIHEENHMHGAATTPPQHLPNVSTIPVAASGRRLSWAAIAASPTKEDCSSMTPLSTSHQQHSHLAFMGRRRRFSSFSMAFQHHHANHEEQDYQCYKAIQYGQQLQKEYQHQSVYIDQLMDIFTLFTCSDLTSSPWLSVSRRDVLASELSSAIQEYQNHPKMSDLELVYRQVNVAKNELVIEGHGKAALLQTV